MRGYRSSATFFFFLKFFALAAFSLFFAFFFSAFGLKGDRKGQLFFGTQRRALFPSDTVAGEISGGRVRETSEVLKMLMCPKLGPKVGICLTWKDTLREKKKVLAPPFRRILKTMWDE